MKNSILVNWNKKRKVKKNCEHGKLTKIKIKIKISKKICVFVFLVFFKFGQMF